ARVRVGDLSVALVWVVSFATICGYVFDARSLYHVVPFSSISVHTTAAFLIAAMALAMARPDLGLTALIVSDTVGGSLIRRAVPFISVFPVLFGWLRLRGQDLGLYDTRFG